MVIIRISYLGNNNYNDRIFYWGVNVHIELLRVQHRSTECSG